jgi:unsaturated rhamnogalacturonyl hydrolase
LPKAWVPDIRLLCLPALALLLTAAPPPSRKVIAVDGWHNREKQPHYRWEGVYNGGFSKLGEMLTGLGAELRTIEESTTSRTLAGIDCLIVVDPDTPAESPDPHYFNSAEIADLERWVNAGGRLLLLGNDKGNAEFEHFNQLAARFGIQFIEGKHATAQGVSKLKLKGPAAHPVFAGGLEFYAVDLAPLRITAPNAEILLSESDVPLMAVVKHGKGLVFALGDPWLYDEYIGAGDNRRIGENLFRYLLWETK